jgi:hypothetical protein
MCAKTSIHGCTVRQTRIANRHTARAVASRRFAGDCLTHTGLGVGTGMPLDGDGTMVGDKITIALAPLAQTEG